MRVLVAAALLSLSLSCAAQEDSSTADSLWLDPVTVTGTRTPHRLSQTPIPTVVITAADIARLDATTLDEVLTSEIPGLAFSFAMDQQTALSLQGVSGNDILVLIDGERLAGETLGTTDFLRLTTADIARVEIIKGAASALYGSQSVGAVVNIITKCADEGWQGTISGHVGSHGEQRYGGSIGVGKNALSALTTVQTNSIDSYTIHDRVGTGSTVVYGNRQWSVAEKVAWQINEKNVLTARGTYYWHQRDYAAYKKNRAQDFAGTVRWESALTTRDHLEGAYTIDRYDKSDYYPSLKLNILSYKNVQNTLRALYTHSFSSALTLLLGGDVLSDFLRSYQFNDDGSHQQWSGDIFAQGEWQIDRHWQLVAGVRGDYLGGEGWQVSPKVAAKYSLRSLNLRLSYARGFRAPSLKERYMSFDMASIFYIVGNTSLCAEHSHSFALSAEYTKGSYNLSATGYYNIMSHEIATLWDSSVVTPLGKGAMVYQNIEGRDIVGVDLSLAARYPCGISAKVAYNYFHEYPHHGEHNYSTTRPHSLVAKVGYAKSWKHYSFDIMLSGRVLTGTRYYTYGDSYAVRDVPATLRGYSLWRLSLTQTLCEAYTLVLTVDNLFNYRPRTFTYTSPITSGTTVAATLTLTLDKLLPHSH